MGFSRSRNWLLVWFVVFLLLVVGIYAPAVRFGLIWDDPEWFGRSVGVSWEKLILPFEDYQFFRPGNMIYNRLFVGGDGTFLIFEMHVAQLALHVLNVSFVFTISRRVGFARWMAFMAAMIFAWHPFGHQAVAWAAPGQPLAAVLCFSAWVFYLAGRGGVREQFRWQRPFLLLLSLFLFLLAVSTHESSVPLAVMPLLFELALRLQSQSWPDVAQSWRYPLRLGWVWPLLYVGAALLFMIVWALMPREGGITGVYLDFLVFAYYLQGFVFPAAGPEVMAFFGGGTAVSLFWLALAGALWALAVYRGRGILATTGILWAGVALLPALLGLSFSYVGFAPRLFYAAAPGAAWVWVAALWPSEQRGRSVAGVLGLALLGAVVLVGVRQVWYFQRLFEPGTRLMTDMAAELSEKNGRYLFLNFPDRYRLKEQPFALGYWGVTLAPVVMDLADFPALLTGSAAQTTSRSMPWLNESERGEGSILVDMRGEIVHPEDLLDLAREYDGVYLTQLDIDGNFALRYAGSVSARPDADCGIARFEDALCLHKVDIFEQNGDLHVRTAWWTETDLPSQLTLFLHLGQSGTPPLTQVDGDTWYKALPLNAWRPGDLIIDERVLPMPKEQAGLRFAIGVYDWVSGERWPGVDADKRPLPDGILVWPLVP
jgi:hypothetical protein